LNETDVSVRQPFRELSNQPNDIQKRNWSNKSIKQAIEEEQPYFHNRSQINIPSTFEEYTKDDGTYAIELAV